MTPNAASHAVSPSTRAQASLALRLLPVALAVVALCPAPALAQSNQELLTELKALKARMADLEKKLEAQEAKQAEATPAGGMAPEQLQDFNRIAMKAEALEDSRDMLGFKGLKVSGYMDPTYLFNQRQHRAGFQLLNSVSDGGFYYDTSYIGTAVLDFVKETDSGSRWHLTLAPQRSTQAVAEGNSSPVQEASVSIPLGDLQTRFIAGHLPDWSGYEMLQPTLNKLITHNLLFDLTLPTAYTGAGLELTRDKWIIKGMLANFNTSKRAANEKTPVLTYRVDYAKGEFEGFGFAGVHGKARNGAAFNSDGSAATNVAMDTLSTADTRLDLFEADAYFIRGDLTAQAQWSWGRQRNAAIRDADRNFRDAYWTGASGLVAYKFLPWLEGVVRADYIYNKRNGGGLLTYSALDDHNGIGPAFTGYASDGTTPIYVDQDKGVNRSALAVGLNYAYNLNTVFKVEYRLDRASGPIFLDTKTGNTSKGNQLLGTAVVVSF